MSDFGKIVRMYGPAFEGFVKELLAAERFGTMTVRVTVRDGLERWQGDCVMLARLADLMIYLADIADIQNDKELMGTYLCLFHEVWDCAKENLSPGEYHDFCEYNRTKAVSPEIIMEIIRTLG